MLIRIRYFEATTYLMLILQKLSIARKLQFGALSHQTPNSVDVLPSMTGGSTISMQKSQSPSTDRPKAHCGVCSSISGE
jgi:hypothetical protein